MDDALGVDGLQRVDQAQSQQQHGLVVQDTLAQAFAQAHDVQLGQHDIGPAGVTLHLQRPQDVRVLKPAGDLEGVPESAEFLHAGHGRTQELQHGHAASFVYRPNNVGAPAQMEDGSNSPSIHSVPRAATEGDIDRKSHQLLLFPCVLESLLM